MPKKEYRSATYREKRRFPTKQALETNKNIKQKITTFIAAASFAAVTSSSAAVSVFADYGLGEAGTVSGTFNTPVDSSGNGHDVNTAFGLVGGSTTVNTSGVSAPGSTAYLSQFDFGYFASASVSGQLQQDDFAFGIYARAAANTTGSQGYLFTLGGGGNAVAIGLEAGGWGASNVFATPFSTGTFAANTWTHLALIRSGGTSTFYINGVAQSGTLSTTPDHDSIHITIDPQAGRFFDGDVDNARIVTFTTGETTANVLSALTVPEPSSALLVGLGAFGLLVRRRR